MSPSAPPFGGGGISSAHFNLYLALRRSGLDARLFTFEDWRRPDEQGIVRRGFPRWPLDAVAIGCELYFRLTCGCRNAYHLADVLRTGPGAAAMGRALRAFAPQAIIVSDHGAPALFFRKPRGARVVLVAHHCPARFRSIPLLEPACERDVAGALALERRMLRAVDAVVCPSAYQEAVFRETYGYQGPTTVVPNLVDRELLLRSPARDLRRQLGLGRDAPIVYMPSAGSRIKGRDVVIEVIRGIALAAREDVGFYLSGPIDRELASAIAALPPRARVHAPGQLPYAENIAAVKACSYAVSPTLAESFGMALLESLQLGLPVVTFAVGANAELVRDGESGFVVRCPDVAALIAAAAALLDRDALSAMRARVAGLGLEKFGADQVATRWREVLFPR